MVVDMTLGEALSYFSYLYTGYSHLPNIPNFGELAYTTLVGEPNFSSKASWKQADLAMHPYSQHSKLEYTCLLAVWLLLPARICLWYGLSLPKVFFKALGYAAAIWVVALALRNTSTYLSWKLMPVPTYEMEHATQTLITILAIGAHLRNIFNLFKDLPLTDIQNAIDRVIPGMRSDLIDMKLNGKKADETVSELKAAMEKVSEALTATASRLDAIERAAAHQQQQQHGDRHEPKLSAMSPPVTRARARV
jgi:hypothetical protein